MKCIMLAIKNIIKLLKRFWLDSWLKTVHYIGTADEFKDWTTFTNSTTFMKLFLLLVHNRADTNGQLIDYLIDRKMVILTISLQHKTNRLIETVVGRSIDYEINCWMQP